MDKTLCLPWGYPLMPEEIFLLVTVMMVLPSIQLPIREREIKVVELETQDLETQEMEPIRRALDMMLEKHNPYPALVIDGNWNPGDENGVEVNASGVTIRGCEEIQVSEPVA